MSDDRTCPTPCDADCETVCHEAHLPSWRRTHQPADCMDLFGSIPDRFGLTVDDLLGLMQ